MRDRNLDEVEALTALLRISQESNRKLRDVAEDKIYHRRLSPGQGERNFSCPRLRWVTLGQVVGDQGGRVPSRLDLSRLVGLKH